MRPRRLRIHLQYTTTSRPFVFPDKKIHLQYTTTSPKLHKVLGVDRLTPVFEPRPRPM
jgi:hypothetical protein